MSNLTVNRSVQFVSLDTHPASNSLVVTYEILVSVLDQNNQRELSRRNKRDQMRIDVSTLDRLKLEQQDRTKTILDIQELSSEIVRKCPLLLSARNNLEDIQLHLLYLLNRHHTQIGSPDDSRINRPISSASFHRLGSSSRLSSARGSSRTQSASGSSDRFNRQCDDLYMVINTKLRNGPRINSMFLERLLDSSSTNDIEERNKECRIQDLEAQIEGLYGDLDEKSTSVRNIMRFCNRKESLMSISSNRLLICALLRTLRDSDCQVPSLKLSEMIICCFIQLTKSQILFESKPQEMGSESTNLVAIMLDLLKNIVARVNDPKDIWVFIGYIGYLVALMVNLLEIPSQRILMLKQVEIMAENTSGLFQSMAMLIKILLKEPSLDSSAQNPLVASTLIVLMKLTEALTLMSTSKEFIESLRRSKSFPEFLSCLINLLSIAQLSRPSSSKDLKNLTRDKETTELLYELELSLLNMTNNMIYDHRIKTRLIKRNLLRCVLRNLVVYLASRKKFKEPKDPTILSPLRNSPVILIPMKSLYELSCDDLVVTEIFKSKIVLKCLIEYLTSASQELRDDVKSIFNGKNKPDFNRQSEHIYLEGSDVCHYVISIWINLSRHEESPIYDEELCGDLQISLIEYIDLVVDTIDHLRVGSKKDPSSISSEVLTPTYSHLKLVANISQNLRFFTWTKRVNRWCKSLVDMLIDFMSNEFIMNVNYRCAHAIESLVILNNLLINSERLLTNEGSVQIFMPLTTSVANMITRSDMAALISNLSANDRDDLMLAFISFIGTLASSVEICPSLSNDSTVSTKLMEAASSILDTKSTDIDLVTCCVKSLSKLMRHSTFVHSFAVDQLGDEEESAARSLVDKLTKLLLSSHPNVAYLSSWTLDRMRQVEEQQSINESHVYRRRFSGFNSKWLNAIRVSREEDLTGGFGRIESSATSDQEDEYWESNEQIMDSFTEELTSEADESPNAKNKHMRVGLSRTDGLDYFESTSEDQVDLYDRDFCDEESEVDDEQQETIETRDSAGFDMSVVDSESMIKHLIGKRADLTTS